MNESERDNAWLTRVRSELDSGVERLEPAIEARLRTGRRQALAAGGGDRFRFLSYLRPLPVGSLAGVAAIAAAASLWLAAQHSSLPHKADEEIEVLTVQGHLEMYRDLEFYQWLAMNHEKP